MRLFERLSGNSRNDIKWPFSWWFIQPVWLRISTIIVIAVMFIGRLLLPQSSLLQLAAFISFFFVALMSAIFMFLEIMRTKGQDDG